MSAPEGAVGFAILPSRSRPRLLLPVDSRAAALSGLRLYHNTESYRGRVLTWLARGLVTMGPRFYAPRPVWLRPEADSVEALVRSVLGGDPVLAAWLGVAGRFSKIVVQVMTRNGDPVAYLKIPMTSEAAGRTRAETRVLARLGIVPALQPFIPRVLFAGEWNGAFVLLQAACQGGPCPPVLTDLHRRFLRLLAQVESAEKSASTVISEVSGTSEGLVNGAAGWHEPSRAALEFAREALRDQQVDCGFSHGDFVPWNMLVHEGQLSVLDWEFAGTGRPAAWDIFHFGVQTATGGRAKVDARCLPEINDFTSRALYFLYLLHSAGALARGGKDPADAGIELRRRLIVEGLRAHGNRRARSAV